MKVDGAKRITRDDLYGYFLEGCTPRKSWLVGMEFEKIGLDAATGRRLPYDGGAASIRSFLEYYLDRRGGKPAYEGQHLVGVCGRWGTITLEPAGQVEWSSRPCRDLGLLEEELHAHEEALRAAADDLGIRWLDDALDPTSRLDDMPWMPKGRYAILKPYLGKRGKLAHRMMTQTTSIQCAFDYENPEDWAAKFKTAALLSPILTAMFANSPILEGRDTGFRSYRQEIWRNTDPDRCGIPPVVFDPGFGLDSWLEWVLDVPTIFLSPAKGLVPAGGVPFRKLLEREGPVCGALHMDDWLLHLSSIFTEVRSYTYIEVRSADLQPPDTIMAVPVLCTGILYSSPAMEALTELCSGHDSHAAWSDAMESASRHALDGFAGGVSLRELAHRTVELSLEGLRDARCVGEPGRTARSLEILRGRLGPRTRGVAR